MTAPSLAHNIASRIAKKHRVGECEICAQEVAKALREVGISGEILAISTGASYGVNSFILSKSRDLQIASNGFHQGVLVEGKVFDNIHPDGLTLGEWIQDFEALGDMTIEGRKF